MSGNAHETAALVTLLRTGARPWAEYVELVEEAGSASDVLATDGTLFEADTAAAMDDIEGWRKSGLRPLTVLDDDYPENLRAAHDRPPLIFVSGELLLEDARSIAVIGGRKPSRSGLLLTVEIVRCLTNAGFTVVSGLAAGIDSAAHRTALESGGRTVAVIATGSDRAYPPQNADLQREVARTGAIVSQFWPGTSPSRANFRARNATMSALSLATVIVEAGLASGTRIQARRALAQGRPLILHESLVQSQPWAQALADNPAAHVVGRPDQVPPIVERLTAPGPLVA